jgi:hypothetical protein
MSQSLIQVENDGFFHSWLGMRQLDHSLLDLIILDWREVLKEAD